MRYLYRLKNKKTHIAIALVLFVGISARIAVASFGHNFDFKSYLDVIYVIEKGRNVYATKVRYNYGPVWFNILYFLDLCTASFNNNQLAFAYAISLLLTLVDIGIFFVINKKIGFIPAVLFFLNPISVIITGFHRQFDNLAILIGMLAVLYLEDNMEISFSRKKIWGLILLGFSLMTKHVFFAFPFWLAVKQRGWWQKFLVFFLPITIFFLSFIPYWNNGNNRIIQKVFLYDPNPIFKVAPLWHWFVPNIIRYFTDPQIIFFIALAGSAFIFRTRNNLESLLIYTAILIITSPIITNQYLAIVIAFIATRFNWLFLVYTLMATWHLLIDGIGLHIDYLIIRTPTGLITYNMMIIVLTLGFLWYYGIQKVGRTIINKVKIQLGWEE